MARIRTAGKFIVMASLLAIPLAGQAASHKVYSTYLWHLQQPIYWPEKVAGLNRYQFAYESLGGSPTYPGHPQNNLTDIFGLDDRKAAYQYRCRDSVAAMSGPDAGAQLSYAGSLIEDVWSLGDHYSLGYGPTWYSPIREAMGWANSRGKRKLEPVGFSYHHAFMPLIDRDARRKEIAINKEIWWKAWGGNSDKSDHPRGFRCSEEAFSERIIKDLVEAGYQWVIVPNHHLSRTHSNYVQLHGKGVYDAPNKADQNNGPNTGAWYSGEIDGRGSTESVPFSFQPHWAKYVDPATGTEYKIIVVPMTDLGSYRDGYSAQGIDILHSLNSQASYDRPCLALFSHDGDNAWGGGFSYYQEAVPNFTASATGAGYRPSTIQSFLDEAPPPAGDVVHVEDGAWFNAADDWGHPQFWNWLWYPQRDRKSPAYNFNDPSTYADIENGWAEDFRNWAVIVAGQNFASTAEQIQRLHGSFDDWKVQEPVQRNGTDNGANDAEKAYHFFLASLDSGYMYYGSAIDMEVKQSLACNQAIAYAQNVIGPHPAEDATPPTVFIPQRYPYNPGATNYGSAYGYKAWVAPSDFYVWTFAFDVSSVTSVVLCVRRDFDGFNPVGNNDNETFAGGASVGGWDRYTMNKRDGSSFAGNIFNAPEINFFITPTAIADEYWLKVTGYNNELLDYYIEATDSRGNITRTDIQHVFVGAFGGGVPVTFTPSSPRTTDPLIVRYNAAGRNLSNAAPVYLNITFDNWATVSNLVMSPAGTGIWTATNTIPAGTTNAIVYLNDTGTPGTGLVDNNGGANWSVKITPYTPPVPATVEWAPALPNSCDPVVIKYKPGTGVLKDAAAVHLHVGRNGWQNVLTPEPAMGWDGTNWVYTYTVTPGTIEIECCFHDGSNIWDNNSGANWSVPVQNCSGGVTQGVTIVEGSPSITPPSGTMNAVGEAFDLDPSGGDAVTVDQGGFGSFGHVYFNYDATHLYVGGMGVDVAGTQTNNAMILFLGLNTLADNAGNLWSINGLPQGLDNLHNLALDPPMDIAIVLGDQWGDGTYTNFNLASGYDFGQGIYYLSSGGTFFPVGGAVLSQFGGMGTDAVTNNYDPSRTTTRWECSLPWSSLNCPGGISNVTQLLVGGIVASSATQGNDRYLSGNYLGYSATNTAPLTNGNFAFSFVTLKGLPVSLPNQDINTNGIPDDWEQRYFGSATGAVATADADEDGLSNLKEYWLGTNPRSAASTFRIDAISRFGEGQGVTWSSIGGKRYQVSVATNLTDPTPFQPLTIITDSNYAGTGSSQICIDTNLPAGVAQRFYRIELAP